MVIGDARCAVCEESRQSSDQEIREALGSQIESGLQAATHEAGKGSHLWRAAQARGTLCKVDYDARACTG